MPVLTPVKNTNSLATEPAITDDEGAAMARAVVNLFDRWDLSDAQAVVLLGGISARTWARWKSGEIGRLSRDLKARLSNLMAIHKALRIILVEQQRAYGWLKRPNKAFGDRSALDVMLGGELTDLMRVRRYLDAERGGW
jgi:putative toxin-antitoxin system antitoxin component (TIGR02293 family)